MVTADTATDLERAVEDLTAASGGGGWRVSRVAAGSVLAQRRTGGSVGFVQ